MKMKTFLICMILLSFLMGTAWAAEIVVPSGDGTLANAVAYATNGDTLILQEGGYSGNVTVNRSLTIRPVNRTTTALISGVMTINGAGIDVTVQGLKFSQTISLQRAAGIRLLENEWLSGGISTTSYKTSEGDGSLAIIGNLINNGRIEDIYTNGAYIAGNVLLDGRIESYSYVWIVGNHILNNDYSPAISTRGSTGTAHIFANRVRCNYGSNISCVGSEAPSTFIANNIIEVYDSNAYSSSQGGIKVTTGHATILNNIVHGLPSSATRDGNAIYSSASSTRVSGNIVTNWVSSSNPITVSSPIANVTNNLCDYNNSFPCPTYGGNILADPLFVDLVDYQLAAGSPAINAGPTDYALYDLNRTRNDIGTYGGPWSIGQYDNQRDPYNYAPYVYPLFKADSIFSGGVLEIRALGVARLR